MRILVFGATGRTGLRVLDVATRRGLTIGAFVRDASRLTRPSIEIHTGDVLRASDVEASIRAGDVVVSCLGGAASSADGGSLGDGTRNIISAMAKVGTKRFLGVVGAGVLQYDAFTRRNQRPDYPPQFHAIGRQHEAMVDALQASSLDWMVVCTPRLAEGDATGKLVRLADYLPDGIMMVTTGDVAELLVEEAINPTSAGRVGVNQRADDATHRHSQ